MCQKREQRKLLRQNVINKHFSVIRSMDRVFARKIRYWKVECAIRSFSRPNNWFDTCVKNVHYENLKAKTCKSYILSCFCLYGAWSVFSASEMWSRTNKSDAFGVLPSTTIYFGMNEMSSTFVHSVRRIFFVPKSCLTHVSKTWTSKLRR